MATANEIKKTMAELKQRFPADLEYEVAFDTTLPVTEGIKEILTTLVEAMILVILVVFLFLQNWRATLIPMIAVPVSLIGTFAVFPFSVSRSTRFRCLPLCSRLVWLWTTRSLSSKRLSITSRRGCRRAMQRSRR